MTHETSTTQPSVPDDSAAPQREWTPIDALAEEWTSTMARLSPGFASSAGLPGDYSAYDDFSPQGLAEFRAEADAVLARLRALEPVDRTDEVTKDALIRDLDLGQRLYSSGWWFRDLNNLASPAQGIRDVYDLMDTDTVEDWELIAARLRNLPRAVEGYIETLRHGAATGSVPALRQIEGVAAQLDGNIGPDGFFAGLPAGADALAGGVPDALRRELADAAAAAGESFGGLQGFLRTELLPQGGPGDAVGRDQYALLSEYFLGAKVDLDDSYEWGLELLAGLAEEQARVAQTIVPGGTVAEAIAALDADPARLPHGTEALRSWMQELADHAVTELGATHFDIPGPVRTIECMIAPTQTGGIYYTGPNSDFSRPGRMWWSVPAGVTEFTTWREKTTVFHEGVPGHHLQIGTAVYQHGTLNSWRRLASGTSGFWEGWALYSERLMADLGYLDDPGDRLGMLDAQRMRAARVVLDIGVHLGKQRPGGGGVWDAEFAHRFFSQNVTMEPKSLDFEINRYLGWPGQAPSYSIGQRVWETTRDEYLAADPERTVRSFHGDALRLGSLGLDSLRTALLA